MKFCQACDEYTLGDPCPRCGGRAAPRAPAKYSPEDRWGEYRRRLKREARQDAQPRGPADKRAPAVTSDASDAAADVAANTPDAPTHSTGRVA